MGRQKKKNTHDEQNGTPIESLREKVMQMHDYISQSHYINMANIEVAGKRCNDVVLYSIMTALLGRNQLFLGNYGLGKTTTAEAVTSLVHGLPVEFVHQSMIRGHPFLTEEKVTGRLDFSKLNTEEKVIFSLFAQTPTAKIIDEINRIKEGTQDMLLESVETGNFQYLNEAVRQSKSAFFATANYQDGGNTKLLPPLLDRFDISVEVSYPLFLGGFIRGSNSDIEDNLAYVSSLLSAGSEEELRVLENQHKFNQNRGMDGNSLKRLLSNPDISHKVIGALTDKSKDHVQKLEDISELSHEFREQLGSLGLSELERIAVPYIARAQGLSPDGELFIDSFFDHMNSVLKIRGEPMNNHNKKYLVGKVENNLSVRAMSKSLDNYSRLLSVLKGEGSVSAETVQEVLPYILTHRAEYKDSFSADVVDLSCSLQRAKSNRLVTEFNVQFGKIKEVHRELYNSLWEGNVGEFLAKYPDSDDPLIKRLYSFYKNNG